MAVLSSVVKEKARIVCRYTGVRKNTGWCGIVRHCIISDTVTMGYSIGDGISVRESRWNVITMLGDYRVSICFKYCSHSMGRSCFFLLLHSLQAGTTFPLVVLPPLEMGTI